ncbi:hypothetical protein SETIT_8G236200v2 [Setaria italica]|uniref:DUF4220 domain-containing protein n=1 Tax=Setaria italica TaxID=4555 RepID=K3ZLK3_SETIT|nr:hypothetical protein SETIT_8G236200v2 [Setaria italica]
MKSLPDSFCNSTVYPYVYNLTSSYIDQNNEATMVTTTLAMFMLAVFFFNLNLFSRFSDVSAILNPSVRLFLSTSLSLFLPVMSYLFSEAKNQGATTMAATTSSSSSYGELGDELSLRARTILMWMLLVELLRKKVEAVLVSVGMQWYSGAIDRFARIVWLGYLVFYNVKSPGKKAIYGTLWVLTAAKFLQRVVVKMVLERSFAYGRNTQLLNSYMAQIIQQEQEQEQEEHSGSSSSAELLKKCEYTVMGEENLERTAGRHGYQVELNKAAVVTVGDIWTQAAAEPDSLLRREHLRRLCLSFALYKLLRRRFEDIPTTREETRNCRNLIFKGLLKEQEGAEVALFQVFNDETQFVCEYYHSVLPVVLSDPFFFLVNYILFPIVVSAFCLLTLIICGNGSVRYAYQSITSDNYIIYTGATTLTRCLLRNIAHSPEVLFASIDLGTTTLLILAFVYEEVVEVLVFILSNWLIVSLLCQYTAKRHWRQSRMVCWLIRGILWVRSMLSHPNLSFKQLSVLRFFQLSSPSPIMVPTKAVPKEVMESIVDYLVVHLDVYGIDGHDDPLNSAWSSTLQQEKHRAYRPLLLPVCESKSIAEFILTCHIATALMEVRYPQDEKEMGSHRKVATTLSKYCTYLVGFYPGLLPDDKNGTKHTYKKMKEDMNKELGGCWWYHLSLQGTRYKRLMEIGESKQKAVTMVRNGARLGTALIEKAEENNEARDRVWELLNDLWTEVMVYVAPSAGDLHVKAHKEALARGGEFITVLWVLCTHTGMTRPALAPWEVARHAFEP